jgi:hypothetical protein
MYASPSPHGNGAWEFTDDIATASAVVRREQLRIEPM